MTQQLAQWACLVMLVIWLGLLLCLVVHGVASREADSAANLTVTLMLSCIFALLLRAAGAFSMIW